MSRNQIYRISLKSWAALSLIYIIPIIIEFLDVNDQYFQNVEWFFYIIPTLILVNLRGTSYGIFSTSIGVVLYLIFESIQPEGLEKHNVIVLIELVIVNVLIFLIVGVLFKKNNKHHAQYIETKHFLESIFQNLNIGIWSVNQKKHLVFSKGIEKLYGLSKIDKENNSDFWRNSVHNDDKQIVEELDEKWKRFESYEYEYRIIRTNGEIRWIRDYGFPVFNNGEFLRYDGTNVDITKQKELELALKESEEKYKYLVEKSLVGVFLMENHQLVYINQWVTKTLGLTGEELLGDRFLELINLDDKNRIQNNYKKLINKEFPLFIEEIQIKAKNGEVKYLELQVALTSNHHDLKIIGIVVDVTDKKKALKDVHYIAYHDSLTGLLNMNYLNKILTDDFEQNRANRVPVTIMFFNLDRFKLINDSYGHSVGDQLLKMVSNRLVDIIGLCGTVIRAGGDEFILYLPNTGQIESKKLASLLLKDFLEPIFLEGNEIRIAASIGIYQIQEDDTFEDAIQKASSALHFAKENGRNQFQLYSKTFGEIANRRLQIEQGLRKALDLGYFELFYQPKLDLFTNKIAGVESLLRWNDPLLGPVPPAEFIPIAEETDVIVSLGKWVLETACKHNSRLQKDMNLFIQVGVNISSRQFLQDDFVSMVQQILLDSGLSPEYLNLEITEGIAIYNISDTIKKLEQLKGLGVSISLDDFGTGYSSLSYLKSLPIDYLKIDQSFINGIEHSHDAAIIRSTISLAHSLGLKVVAEGVEYKEQQIKLEEKGCDEIQGYFFAKPMPSLKFIQFLKGNNNNDLKNKAISYS